MVDFQVLVEVSLDDGKGIMTSALGWLKPSVVML